MSDTEYYSSTANGTFVQAAPGTDALYLGRGDIGGDGKPIGDREAGRGPLGLYGGQLFLYIHGFCTAGAIGEIVWSHLLGANYVPLSVTFWVFLLVLTFGWAAHLKNNVKLMTAHLVLLVAANVAVIAVLVVCGDMARGRVKRAIISVATAHCVVSIIHMGVVAWHRSRSSRQVEQPAEGTTPTTDGKGGAGGVGDGPATPV